MLTARKPGTDNLVCFLRDRYIQFTPDPLYRIYLSSNWFNTILQENRINPSQKLLV